MAEYSAEISLCGGRGRLFGFDGVSCSSGIGRQRRGGAEFLAEITLGMGHDLPGRSGKGEEGVEA